MAANLKGDAVAKSVFRIGTRKSDLAQTQSTTVMNQLKALGLEGELVFIESSGDKDRKTPLYENSGAVPGLFTKELEEALADNRIDLAVHSLKDLPTLQPKGLEVLAITKRENAADTLLVHPKFFAPERPLRLAEGATVGTSSLRREAQLLAVRPDLKVVPLRGNVPTRLKKVVDNAVNATVLAQAGLNRLGLDLSAVGVYALPPEEFVAAPGQGALALETRTGLPSNIKAIIAQLNDEKAFGETTLERKLLRELEGGCTLPLGVRAKWKEKDVYELRAFLGVIEKGAEPRNWKSFPRFHAEGISANLLKEAMAFFGPFRTAKKDSMKGEER